MHKLGPLLTKFYNDIRTRDWEWAISQYQKTGLKNKLLTSKKIWLLTLILLTKLENSLQIWPHFGPFLTLWRLKDCWISKFHKNDRRSNFKNFPLLFGCNILPWNCFEEFGKVTSKRSPRFPPSSNYFAKI